jgi:hypothetical protein
MIRDWIAPLAVVFALAAVPATAAAPWRHPLYLGGGGHWAGRVAVTVRNQGAGAMAGTPVVVPIGEGPQQAALAGKAADAVRVVRGDGVEVMFAIHAAGGERIERGPIAAGSLLVLPAECPARGEAVYYVYFDNPSAGPLPDFLDARPGLVNGDVETGKGNTPAGWRHDEGDSQHRAAWSTTRPQSGGRCLETVVDEGAEPTWIATRQHGIPIAGGAKYRMTAWVRAENVRGMAGWYMHVGNRENAMLIAPMLSAGEGTFDWKQVQAEFTAPEAADRADLGTVLRGTGTAWFDNVMLERLDPGSVVATAAPPERLELAGTDATGDWYGDPASPTHRWDHRAVVRAFNFSSEAAAGLTAVNLRFLDARMRGRLCRDAIVVTFDGRPVPHFVYGDALLIETELPPRSSRTYCVYLTENAVDGAKAAEMPALVGGPRNLVRNPSFEQGEKLPDDWTGGAAPKGVTYGLDTPGKLGNRAARLDVAPEVPEEWRGWHQTVPVRPGRTYLYSGWMKCRGVGEAGVKLHAHLLDAQGKVSPHGGYTAVGPTLKRDADWTLMAGTLTMPEDAVQLGLHLTMNQSGTLWHDGLLVAEVIPAELVRFEGRPMPSDAIALWQVPAVEKVFPDTPAPREVPPRASISAARNEREPLQLAVRSGRAVAGVRVEVDPPTDAKGRKLDDAAVRVIGYVPVDYPTNYYNTEAPAWVRKVPHATPGCDGWPGLWPDPLLPSDRFDLAAGATQAVWLDVGVGRDAPPGDYRGRVRLVAGGRVLAEMPFDVHVWGFTLPNENHVGAIYDVRLGEGDDLWGGSLDRKYPEIIRFMAAHRLCPDTIRPAPEFRREGDKITADFTAFDEAARLYFDELKFPFAYTPWHFYLFGWGHPPKNVFGEKPYNAEPPFAGVDRGQLRPEYRRAYQQSLRLFWDHLKERGWDKRVVLYISDEPFDRQKHIQEQMKALCDMIHEVDPAIPIYCSTWHHVPEWNGYLDVWGIGHYGCVPVEKINALRAAGDRVWFTTDGQMCTDTPYCAVERLLPHYCFKYEAEAYEFWGVAWLTYDPYRFGWHAYIHQSMEPGRSFWVRYPNGDGFLLYPGEPIGHKGPVSSVRFEQAREGVEDFEYLYLLRDLIAKAKAAGRDVREAEAAMTAAAALVEIPNAGGRHSSKILSNPAAVYEARAAVAQAIERLSAVQR